MSDVFADMELAEQSAVLRAEVERLRARYTSAVETLRDIAQMSGKVGSETAAHRLRQLGEPRYLDEDLTDAARAKVKP